MKQLTFKDLAILFEELTEKYTEEEVLNMPIYIGDDDEINGVHTAWGCEMLDIKEEDDEYLVHMINDTAGNIKLTDKGILIS